MALAYFHYKTNLYGDNPRVPFEVFEYNATSNMGAKRTAAFLLSKNPKALFHRTFIDRGDVWEPIAEKNKRDYK